LILGAAANARHRASAAENDSVVVAAFEMAAAEIAIASCFMLMIRRSLALRLNAPTELRSAIRGNRENEIASFCVFKPRKLAISKSLVFHGRRITCRRGGRSLQQQFCLAGSQALSAVE
jgi:hypothetical protein